MTWRDCSFELVDPGRSSGAAPDDTPDSIACERAVPWAVTAARGPDAWRRGLSSSPAKSEEGGGTLPPITGTEAACARCADGPTSAGRLPEPAFAPRPRDAPQATHLAVPIVLNQSQRPQTTPSSKSIDEAETTKEVAVPPHQMMLSRWLPSLKPAALTMRNTMCWQAWGLTCP